jgi:hypothetical protein
MRELGAKGRIVPAFDKIALRRVRLDLQRVIHLLVGPQAVSGNHPVVDFAQIPQVLTPHMSRLVTIEAHPRLIDDQHSACVGSCGSILAQQREPLGLYLALIPVRLREKPLQPLGSWELGSHDWLGID